MKLLEGKVAIITGASAELEKELQKFLQNTEQMLLLPTVLLLSRH
jgi:short-subunit dehydrogenase